MASMTKTIVRPVVEEDLCDTASGDTDDVCSLCSWTTDQGDFMENEAHARNGAQHNVNAAAWGVGQDCMTMPHPQGMPGGCMPVCVGYVPMPMCYVVMPVDNTHSEQWPVHPPRQWGESNSQPPGTWSKPHASASTGRGAPRAKNSRESIPIASHGFKSTGGKKDDFSGLDPGNTGATTIILRNLPVKCTCNMLMQLLDDEGFYGDYNFVHLPIDFQTKVGLGYAIVNLVRHSVALQVVKHFQGFTRWPVPSDSVCEVAWNAPHQGLATHIDRYRNSPLMHPRVPDSYRPVLLENGVRVAFPAPTSRIRAPRIRHQKVCAAVEA